MEGTPSAFSFLRKTPTQYNQSPNYFGDSLEYGSKYSSMLDNGDTGLSSVVKQDMEMGLSFNEAMKNATANRNFASGNILDQSTSGDRSWSEWFGDKGNQFMVHTGLGVGQLGLGLASYLQQSDFMKKQGKLLDQQLASNQYEIDRRQGFDRNIADPNGAFATAYRKGSAPTQNEPANGQA